MSKISQLTTATDLASTDLLEIVDVSDTATMGVSTGTNKKITALTLANQLSTIGNYAQSSHTHSNASTTTAGFMSSTDKTKLDNIASGAEVNVQADWNATTGDAFIQNKPGLATTSLSGFMSSTDKSKLDKLNSHNNTSTSIYGVRAWAIIKHFDTYNPQTSQPVIWAQSGHFSTVAFGGDRYYLYFKTPATLKCPGVILITPTGPTQTTTRYACVKVTPWDGNDFNLFNGQDMTGSIEYNIMSNRDPADLHPEDFTSSTTYIAII